MSLAALTITSAGCKCDDCDEDGFTAQDGDCDDTDPSVNPDAEEYCDEIDNDCDGQIDEDVGSVWYRDADADSWGDATDSVQACVQPSGYVSVSGDCDDTAATTYPGAAEICDGVDNNCDDHVDEGLTEAWYRDADEDGYGTEDDVATGCVQPDGYISIVGDCDDTDPAINPGAEEVCDGVDNNCDGSVDEGTGTTYYVDADSDGYGEARQANTFCDEPPDGYSDNDQDCDDTDPNIHPGAVEVCDGIDNDCSGVIDDGVGYTYYADADGDGYGNPDDTISACDQPEDYVSDASDCDDNDPAVNPGAEEVCDGVDNNCDGQVDEVADQTFYQDADGDGYGDPAITATGCDAPEGYVSDASDCDDTSADINPGADEVCDGVDNNCDGQVDEGMETSTWYADTDGDGYGDSDTATSACVAPDGYVDSSGDCNDDDPAVNPGAQETCNGVDDNCDGQVDEGWEASTWYADTDGDGWGDNETSLTSCEEPEGYVPESGDCDDTDPTAYPGADEVCDGVDNNCDGNTDEGFTWYLDADGDGYGVADTTVNACDTPDGYTSVAGDCDDSDAAVHPDAPEICGDGIDQDCDGLEDDAANETWYRDRDQDGFGSTAADDMTCGAQDGYVRARGDCDDSDDTVHPGADDAADDGVDSDCGGTDGAQPHVGLSASSMATIQEAINAASDGDVVWVGPGVYLEHDISMLGKAITLVSTEGPDQTMVDAEGLGRGFVFENKESADTVLKGFTITRGTSSYGGGINGFKSSPVLEDLVLTGNTATTAGGGFAFAFGNPVLRDVVVEDNTVPLNLGGGGFANSGANIVMEHVVFRDNSSKWGGAGFSGKSVTITLHDATFEGNSSWIEDKDEVSGGGLSLQNATGEISDVRFVQNRGGSGGGVSLKTSDVILTRAEFTDNVAYLGGALYLEASDITLSDATLSGNSTEMSCTSICEESTCTECDAMTLGECVGGQGGGVFILNAAPTFQNVVIMENFAQDGGGVYASGASPVFHHTYVYMNRASAQCWDGGCVGGSGGGIFSDDTTWVLKNVLIGGNQATPASQTQAISYVDDTESCTSGTLRSCSGGQGGALYLSASTGTFAHIAVIGNLADSASCPADSFDSESMFGGTGGIDGLDGTLVDSILAWNNASNLADTADTAVVTYSDLYNPPGAGNHDLANPDPSILTVEPGFLAYDQDGMPSDIHLALSSPLIDAGDPSGTDVDGSPSDMGVFGGSLGNLWDLDWDGTPDYFWPGTIQDAPQGYDPADYDCAPFDPETTACN